MDLIGGQVRRSAAIDAHLIPMCAIGQRPHPHFRIPSRRVFVTDELGKFPIGRKNLTANGVQELRANPRPIRLGHRIRKLRQRFGKGRLLRILIGDRLRLPGHLPQEELRRHQAVVHAAAHEIDRPVDLGGQRAQTRDVVVVVLRRVECQEGRQLRGKEMPSPHLIDRHLVLFELRVFNAVAQVLDHQRLVDLLLIGEAGRVDGLEASKEAPVGGQIALDRRDGDITRFVVEALVAEDRGILRIGAQNVLPLLREQVVECLPSFVEIRSGELCGRHSRRAEDSCQGRGQMFLHPRSLRHELRVGWGVTTMYW